MRLSQFALGVAVVAAASTAVATAQAEDGIYIPLMSYRTGPYSGAGLRSSMACRIIWIC